MIAEWHFTDLEFVVAWEAAHDTLVPRPFVYTSRIVLREDNIRVRREVGERLRERLGADFGSAVEALSHPDIRAVVRGWRGAQGDPRARVRILAARRGDRGYLVDQEPGETVWHSRSFTVWAFHALQLGPAVAGALPAEKPGLLGTVALDGDDAAGHDHRFRRSRSHEDVDDAERDDLETFRTANRVGAGVIEVAQGRSRFGPRGMARREIEWTDLESDGRYVIAGAPRRATPVGDDGMRAVLDGEIAEIVAAIKDER